MKNELSILDRSVLMRKWVLLNAFISLIILGIVIFRVIYAYYQLEIYSSALKTVTIFYVPIFILGTLIGRWILRYKKYVNIFRIVEICFLVTFILFNINDKLLEIIRLIELNQNEKFVLVFFTSAFVVLFFSIKTYYMLGFFISEFIDGKEAIFSWLIYSLIGLSVGIILVIICIVWQIPFYASLAFSIPLPITCFFSYGPLQRFDHYSKEESDDIKNLTTIRDDIFINYLNFSFTTLYLYFAYLVIVSIFGYDLYVQMFVIIIVLFSFSLGILISKRVKNVFWFYFSEMLFPVAMIVFMVLVYVPWKDEYEIGKIFVTSVPSFVFGFACGKSVENIFKKYDVNKRDTIIYISLFVLPISLLTAIAYVDFTKVLFYFIMYLFMAINILVPGIFFVNQKIHYVKKIFYFIFCLIFVPLIVYLHTNLNIPIDNTLYINHVKNFNLLYNNKYDSLYISNNKNIEYHKRIIFENSDGAIRNLQRILVPLYMYVKDDKDEIMIFNGNHKFYKNPIMGLFKNLTVIDYVPERNVDYNTLPLGGEGYFVERGILPKLLNKKRDGQYDIILDMPNLFDQQVYEWRISKDFYLLTKKKLKNNGIFAQTFNVNYIHPLKLSIAKQNIERVYSAMTAFAVANQLMFIASDNQESIKINQKNYYRVNELYKSNDNMIYLFYNPNHILWHFVEPKFLNIYGESHRQRCEEFLYYMSKRKRQRIVPENYEINFDVIISSQKENVLLKEFLLNQYKYDKDLFLMLRKAEISEEEQDYLRESETIQEIYRKYAFRNDVTKYIKKIIALKEEFYLNRALQFEKEKNWEEAKKMYYAILKINENAFEPNYRLGILNITIQNIEEALKHMNIAIKMKSDDPRVNYQMGVLMFSNGKHVDALKYFEKSRQLKNESASLYLYMGMCNEAMGKIYEAKENYIKAAFLDPNDSTIKTSIDRINEKIQMEINKWKTEEPKNQNEDEQGENIPLPVNKSAYEYRITDQEAKKLKDSNN